MSLMQTQRHSRRTKVIAPSAQRRVPMDCGDESTHPAHGSTQCWASPPQGSPRSLDATVNSYMQVEHGKKIEKRDF